MIVGAQSMLDEATLEDSRLWLQLALDSAGMVVWDWNLKSGQVTCSENAREVWGFEIGTAEAFINAIHPDDRAAVWRAHEAAIEGGGQYVSEYRMTRPNGKARRLRSEGRVYFDADGRASRIIGVSADVTARRESEERLRESEQRLQTMLNQAAVGIIVVALDGRMLEVNDRMCQIVGRGRDVLLTLSCADLTHPDDWNCNRVMMEEVAAGSRGEFVIEKRYGRPDGSWVWVNVTVSPLLDAAGRPERLLAVVQDIEARKRAEAALAATDRENRRARAELEAVVNTMADGLLVADGAGNLLYMNPASLRLHGYASLEEVRRHLSDFPAIFEGRDAAGRVVSLAEWPLSRVLRGESFEGYELHIRRQDTGLTFHGSYSGAPVRDASGHVSRAVVTVTDITKSKEAEERLRESEERFARAFEASPVALTLTSLRNGRLTEVNETFVRLTGYTRAEAVGRTTDELGLWANPGDRTAELAMIAERGRLRNLEYRFRMKNGRELTGLLSAERLEIGGEPCALTVIQDITERKWAERELRESEAHFRGLADAMPQLVWTSNSDGRVDYYNSRIREYGGITSGDDGTWDWQPVVHEEDLPATIAAWRSAVRAAAVYECEHRIRLSDGSYRWHLSRAVPLRDGYGKVVKWFGTATDIHELRESQQVLRENDRRKDEFLAMLAHELRNPLAPIRNAVQVLRRLGPSTPQVEQMRDMIERQAEHLARLVDDLLDVARITQGKIELHPERADIFTIISRAVETSRPLIESRRHQLTVALPEEALRVEGDVVRLAQAVSNLLHNAAKYTPEGGQLRLRAARDGGEVLLRVKDNGVGIPEKDLPYVFDLFAQSDRSLDRAQGGLGIGLTLVKRLVELHGGRVEAFSDGPGHGSEFVIRLPLLAPAQPAAESPADANLRQSPRAACCRVLVVDDNVDSADSMGLLLQFEGHDVEIAYDGPAAVEAARRTRPQVVLLDIGLPGMSGYEVARALRCEPGLDRAVLIALTGYGQEEDRTRAEAAGFDHHLTKPVDYESLGSLIKTLI